MAEVEVMVAAAREGGFRPYYLAFETTQHEKVIAYLEVVESKVEVLTRQGWRLFLPELYSHKAGAGASKDKLAAASDRNTTELTRIPPHTPKADTRRVLGEVQDTSLNGADGTLRKKRNHISQDQPRLRTSQRPALILESKRATRISRGGRCSNCGMVTSPLWQYSKSNYGTVKLCSQCQNITYMRSHGAADAMSIALRAGLFERNRRKH